MYIDVPYHNRFHAADFVANMYVVCVLRCAFSCTVAYHYVTGVVASMSCLGRS